LRTVGKPTSDLIKPASPDIGIKHPERHLDKLGFGETGKRGAHEPPADPFAPGAWQHINRVDLTD
jgi:hypothetical protein